MADHSIPFQGKFGGYQIGYIPEEVKMANATLQQVNRGIRRLRALTRGSRGGSGGSPALPVGRRRRFNPKKRKVTGKIKIDGTSTSTRRMKAKRKSKRRKKKSLKDQIKQVKKLLPVQSYKTFRDFKTMVFASGNPNEHKVYFVDVFTRSEADNYASNLTLVDTSGVADYTGENSKLKMSRFYKLELKNNMTSNCTFTYCFFKCKDSTNGTPADMVLNELTDRGYTGVPSKTALSPATATSSEIPGRIIFGHTNIYHAPIFSGNDLNRNWEKVGKVAKATVGPGDSTSIYYTDKITYKQEEIDAEATTFSKKYSVICIVSCSGDISHDQTNTDLIGRGLWQLDCEEQKQVTVVYSNPKGLKQVAYTDTLTNTNFTVPVHADNRASAIEVDDK